jgi:hypothetical protein
VSTKQKGICPFCNKAVAAHVIQGNTVRRDKCKCPECGEFIYLCRTPGCHDYAKGTDTYDHELCPSCTATAGEAAKGAGSFVAKAALIVLGIVATAFAKKRFGK